MGTSLFNGHSYLCLRCFGKPELNLRLNVYSRCSLPPTPMRASRWFRNFSGRNWCGHVTGTALPRIQEATDRSSRRLPVRADNAPRPFRRAMRCPHGPASKRASPPGHGICRRGCAKRPRRITCGRHVWSLIARGRGSRLVTGKGNRSHATSFLLPDRDHDDGRLLTHRNICPEIESCGCPWLPVENRESSVSCPHLGTILECPTAPIERSI
jgi:hypothetical protein